MDFRLNDTGRSVNLSVYLVFDLVVEQFQLLGENWFGTRGVENELSTVVLHKVGQTKVSKRKRWLIKSFKHRIIVLLCDSVIRVLSSQLLFS